MKLNHILLASALMASLSAGAATLTVTHTTMGDFANEFAAALTANGLSVGDVNELVIVSADVDGNLALFNTNDFAAIRTNYGYSAAAANKNVLKKIDFSNCYISNSNFGNDSQGDIWGEWGPLSRITSLTDVILPEHLTLIVGGFFNGCTNLVNVNIPNSVRTIGKRAFYQLSKVKIAELPSALQSVYDEAFFECTNLTASTLAPTAKNIYSSAFRKTNVSFSDFPEGLITVDNNKNAVKDQFIMCPNITTINIPNSWTAISDRAFYLGDGAVKRTINFKGETLPSITTNGGGSSDYSGTFGKPEAVAVCTLHIYRSVKEGASYTGAWKQMKCETWKTTMTVNTPENGTISHPEYTVADGAVTLDDKYAHTFTLTPANGYILDKVLFDDEDVTAQAIAQVDEEETTPSHYQITLPVDGENNLAVTFKEKTQTGIAAVEAENAPVEYFNLQGVRVNNPANGVYIMRQGTKVTKVVR